MAKSKNKKSKSKPESEEPPPVPEGWDRCHAYIVAKRRFCRQIPLPVKVDDDQPTKRAKIESEGDQTSKPRYCGNHQLLWNEKLFDNNDKNLRKSIPCPVDPSHMIYEDQLEKHIKVCPKTKHIQREKSRPYYRENVNGGGHGSKDQIISDSSELSMDWAVRVARRVLQVHSQLRPQIEDKDRSASEIQDGLEESLESYRIKSGGSKHLPQLASLVGHLRDVVDEEDGDNETILLELGAGRGMFGLVSAGMSNAQKRKTNLVMVERAGGTKSKADTVLRGVNHGTMERKKYKGDMKSDKIGKDHLGKLQGIIESPNEAAETLEVPKEDTKPAYLNLKGIEWSRIVGDLAHVHLPTAMNLKNENSTPENGPIFVLAKHLCGAGTDLALKSMASLTSTKRLRGCLLATCCHGVCNWNDYVGRDYLCGIMTMGDNSIPTFGSSEFELLRKWSTGTVKDVANNPNKSAVEEDEHNTTSFDALENDPKSIGVTAVVDALADESVNAQILGRACQRLIDYGRQEYLNRVVFANGSSEMCHYVSADVTPQNALLIGRSGK